METPATKKFSIVFEGSERAPYFPVSGAWGGVCPTGNSVVVSFFQALSSLPNVISSEVAPGAAIDPSKGTRVTHGDITQRVMVTLVMTPEDCLSIATWMTKKGQEAITAREQKKKGQSNI